MRSNQSKAATPWDQRELPVSIVIAAWGLRWIMRMRA
jgi:hypothetical protein